MVVNYRISILPDRWWNQTFVLRMMMWLPKDERRLLAGYYSLIGKIDTEKAYRFSDLARLLRCCGHKSAVPEYGNADPPSNETDDLKTIEREAAQYIDDCIRIEQANKLLAARDLITFTPHQPEINACVIGLSVEGYDLGRRYSSLFESSGLLFQAYRNHWIWLIVAFFTWPVGAKLIEWIGSLLN